MRLVQDMGYCTGQHIKQYIKQYTEQYTGHTAKRPAKRLAVSITCIMLAALCALSLTACSGKDDDTADKRANVSSDYSAAQMYILMGSMREAVADTYSEDVFSAVVDGEGHTYDDKFLGIMHDYIEKLTLMRAMADERGLKLTSDEERAVGKLADSYMEDTASAAAAKKDASAGAAAASGASDTAADDVSDITKDDVVKVFTDQVLVTRLREDIMGGSDIEISESEARVMDVSMIVTTSSDSANEAMAQITDGKDFLEVAAGYTTEEKIEKKVCREDLPATLTDTVFGLEDGEISPVMQDAGKYYIVKCDVGYDVEETAARKAALTRERKRQSIGTAYAQFCEGHVCTLDDETWTAAVQMYEQRGSLPDIFEYMDED